MRKLTDTILTMGKIAVMTRRVGKPVTPPAPARRLIILGNGPSLRQIIDGHADLLAETETMAVNFAANTPEYFNLRPARYILTDPHFFEGAEKDPNVRRLWENLQKTSWDMTLHVPARRKIPALPANIRVQRYNMTPGEGLRWVCRRLYKLGMATPRPRNVLIAALMEAIRSGYEEIYLTGADHSWPHTLYVDGQNRVVSVQPHYYQDNKEELERVADVYSYRRMHDVLGNMAVAFRSYHQVRDYADWRGVKIYNATPESLIDAFERRPLPEKKAD